MKIKNESLIKLRCITFTGIDTKTPIEQLIELARKYPKVEFGFLVHANHHRLGNRYCSPSILREYQNAGLPLSLHVCGELNRRIITKGDWSELNAYMRGAFSLFQRVQLNIGSMGKIDVPWKIVVPPEISEVIIQQSSATNMPIYQTYLSNRENIQGNFTVLFDLSRGRGIYKDTFETAELPYAGYAGGLAPNNVADTVLTLEMDASVQNYWIDMESHVRSKQDWFSVELCRKVCEELGEYSLDTNIPSNNHSIEREKQESASQGIKKKRGAYR